MPARKWPKTAEASTTRAAPARILASSARARRDRILSSPSAAATRPCDYRMDRARDLSEKPGRPPRVRGGGCEARPGRSGGRDEAPATARAGARGAAEAVRAGRDRLRLELGEGPQVEDAARSAAERELEHLVEVAVVERAVEAHRHRLATHELRHGAGIEVAHEQRHVLGRPPIALERVREALDRHVRQREQAPEADPEARAELRAVARLELGLRRRERGALRVVDEVELEPRAGFAVAERAEAVQRGDAALEDAAAALRVDVLGAVAGKRGDDAHPVRGEELRGVLLARELEYRQVAAVDD